MARIFLIGPMGSGKTTVGKALARKLNYPFIDTDKEIEARCGVDIPTIFEFEGETGFRDREHKIINELTRTDPVILATGGGSILDETNRKRLHGRGHVILLSVDIKEQLRRVSLNRNRPLLQVDDVEKRLVKLMDQRRDLYESTAHYIVNTNSSRMQNVLAKITRHLQRNNIVDVVVPSRASRRPANKKTASNAPKSAGSKISPAEKHAVEKPAVEEKIPSSKPRRERSAGKTKTKTSPEKTHNGNSPAEKSATAKMQSVKSSASRATSKRKPQPKNDSED